MMPILPNNAITGKCLEIYTSRYIFSFKPWLCTACVQPTWIMSVYKQ